MAPEATRINFRLYVVTDRQQTAGRPLEEVLVAAARGGAGTHDARAYDPGSRDAYDPRSAASRLRASGASRARLPRLIGLWTPAVRRRYSPSSALFRSATRSSSSVT